MGRYGDRGASRRRGSFMGSIRSKMSQEDFDSFVEERGLEDWVEDFGYALDRYGKAYDSVYDESSGRATTDGAPGLDFIAKLADGGTDAEEAADRYMEKAVSAGYRPSSVIRAFIRQSGLAGRINARRHTARRPLRSRASKMRIGSGWDYYVDKREANPAFWDEFERIIKEKCPQWLYKEYWWNGEWGLDTIDEAGDPDTEVMRWINRARNSQDVYYSFFTESWHQVLKALPELDGYEDVYKAFRSMVRDNWMEYGSREEAAEDFIRYAESQGWC